MRLLRREDANDYRLTDKLLDRDLPRYGILSHTWGLENEEVTFEDVGKGAMSEKIGYSKIKFCAEQAAQDGLDHCWIDSCCINRSSSPELSEAIISMFRWYSRAAKCYVYLSDVSAVANGVQQPQEKWEAAFRASKWFTRGWTLQELLAPKLVEFYSCEGKRLGDRESLKLLIQAITRIDVQALQGVPLSRFDVDDRIAWASRRATKLEEDEAYSLIGMFGVSMGPRYGEGRESALSRLYNKIARAPNTGRMGPPSKRARTDSHIEYDLFDPSQFGVTSTSPSGRDVPRSLQYNEQVETWNKRNNLFGTEKLFSGILEARKRTVGPDHPETPGSMITLASTFREQGRWHDAERLLKQAV
ncbi:MAG: hypothetical protein M1820_005860 [Bogoriella megaspora]|nr:MAG: hypothetical protein M1820_005860 [Bogoriella megaspora]